LNDENIHIAAPLVRGGIKVFSMTRCRDPLKVNVIDSRYMFLGSHFLTEGSLRQNNEFSVLIDSPEIAAETLSYPVQL
jgi:phosphatidylserine/phosphatidylglycerophosphate/cardiolipin synthase-like enzyme